MSAHRLLALSLLLIAAACGGSTPAAPSSAGDETPSFGTGNGPLTPGHSFVIRSNDGIFLSTVDEVNGLVVRHYNTEDIDFCGGATATPTAEAQLVLTPGAAIYTWRTGELPVYVYLLSEVPPQQASEQFCQDLKTKWIYRGTHRLTNHDNNLFFEPGRTNAFGWNGEGTMFNRAGKRFSYRESLMVTVATDPPRLIHERYILAIR